VQRSRPGVARDRQPDDACRWVGAGRLWCCLRDGELVRKQVIDVRLRLIREAGDQGVERGVRLNLRRIEVELASPDEARLLAQVDNPLEETLKDIDPEPLPDAGQAGVVGQRLVERIAQVPAVGQVEGSGGDELPFFNGLRK
jgi:hypothetical protein